MGFISLFLQKSCISFFFTFILRSLFHVYKRFQLCTLQTSVKADIKYFLPCFLSSQIIYSFEKSDSKHIRQYILCVYKGSPTHFISDEAIRGGTCPSEPFFFLFFFKKIIKNPPHFLFCTIIFGS